MCKACDVVRKPIGLKRRAITVASDHGQTRGGWFAFPKPDEETPRYKLPKNRRVLWCPWCGQWSEYKRVPHTDRWNCLGVCGWGNTEEWYVKTYNKLWWENVPLSEMKKITVPAPAKRRK